MSAVASPLFTDASGEAVAALALVVPEQRLAFFNLDRVVEAVKDAAARISTRVRALIES